MAAAAGAGKRGSGEMAGISSGVKAKAKHGKMRIISAAMKRRNNCKNENQR